METLARVGREPSFSHCGPEKAADSRAVLGYNRCVPDLPVESDGGFKATPVFSARSQPSLLGTPVIVFLIAFTRLLLLSCRVLHPTTVLNLALRHQCCTPPPSFISLYIIYLLYVAAFSFPCVLVSKDLGAKGP